MEKAETQASYKEKLDKYKNDFSVHEEEEDVEEIYINAIKSKLAMLEGQNDKGN